MGKQLNAQVKAAARSHFYCITPKGKAIASDRQARLNSRYLLDLLNLLDTCERGVGEWELRQFMPPASLRESIGTLLDLELIKPGS